MRLLTDETVDATIDDDLVELATGLDSDVQPGTGIIGRLVQLATELVIVSLNGVHVLGQRQIHIVLVIHINLRESTIEILCAQTYPRSTTKRR